MVNSSWTKNHIASRWPLSTPKRVYPPVDCRRLMALPLAPRAALVVSLAQFRPEKNHMLQVEAFALFIEETGRKDVKLAMIGSVRKHKKGDAKRVERLRERIKDLQLEARSDPTQTLSHLYRTIFPFTRTWTMQRSCLSWARLRPAFTRCATSILALASSSSWCTCLPLAIHRGN